MPGESGFHWKSKLSPGIFPGSVETNYDLKESVIETRHLRIFVAVYHARSFTKAAEQLYTSQPTVSEHIQNLESRLNCKLFDRLGRTIMPTNQADILYPRAKAILEDLGRLEHDVSNVGDQVSGELIIGASTIPDTYILPQLAASFKKQYPDISFEIRINDSARIADNVSSHELFLGVVGAKIPNSKLKYIPFAEDELILAAAGDRNISNSLSPEQLCNLPFIIRERGSGTRKSSESMLSEINLSPNRLNITATLGSSAAVKEAVKADLGVSIISRHAIIDELQSGVIQPISIQGLQMNRSFYIVSAKRRTLPNHYMLFREQLLNSSDSFG